MADVPRHELLSVMEQATRTILALVRVTGWPDHEGEPTPADINHGRCVEWAELVCSQVPGAAMAEWDDPPSGLLHTFVVLGGRYYDADCLDGADDVTSLPIFHDPMFT